MIRPTLAAVLSFILTPGLLFCLGQAPATPTTDPAAASQSGAPAVPAPATAIPAEEPQPPAEENPEKGPESPEQARRDALRARLQPPDGKWLVDDEGRSYFIQKHPKSQPHKLLGEARVRIVYGGEYDLAGQDEESLWLKVYRLDDKPIARRPAKRAPTPEELAASAATFPAPTATVDRLHLKAFDAGLPTHGLWRNGFDLADVNGDGEIDFVHGPTRRGGDQPRIFLGDGHGSWRPYKVTVPPGLLDYGDVKVADFNGDGKADLAAASHLRGVSVFVGDGAGNFSSWREGLDFDAPRPGYDASGFSSRRIEVLDWNRDGKPDLLALNEGPRLSILETGNEPKASAVEKLSAGEKESAVEIKPEAFGPKLYLNQGDGTWVALADTGSSLEIFGDDLAVADFDGNGSPDFLTSTNVMGRLDLLYVQGKVAGGAWTSIELPLRPKAYVNAVATGDFDRDRRADLALTYTSFELGVNRVGLDLYLARRDGQWERRPVFVQDGRVALSALDSGDLDGDKLPDLVATDHDGFLYLFLGDGNGGFAREESPEAHQPRGPCRGYGLRMADIDRDGRAEIVASYAGEANPIFDPHRCPGGGGVSAWTLKEAK